MADFLQLMNRIKSAEKGQLYKKNEDRLLDEDDEEQSLDLRGVFDDDRDLLPPE